MSHTSDRRRPFKSERAAAIHMARVYLAQARCARHRHQWHATLLRWAAGQRRAAQQPTGARPC